MGGRKKKGGLFGSVESLVTGAAKSGLQVGTGGIYDPNTGTIKTGESQLNNVMSGVSGQTLAAEMSGPTPNMPQAEDPAEQALRAKAEADAAVAKELNLKNGLAQNTTILGGSLGEASNLRKKKLLGE